MIRVERHLDQRGPFGEIVVARADKRNALSVRMLEEMARGIADLAADDRLGALVVRGDGRFFCAGFDLPACLDDPEQLRGMLRGLSSVVRGLRRFPRPVVLAVQGGAVAGGCALLGGADVVVVDRSAKLGYPVLKLGISPAVTAPMLRLLGRACRERLFDPELIGAEEAVRIGLAHIQVDLPDDVVPRAQTEAMKFAVKPAAAVARTRAWLNEIEGSLGDAEFDRALEVSLSLVGSPEERGLLAAVLGKPRGD